MFDYVKRSELYEERTRRIRAEEYRDNAIERTGRLTEMLETERREHREELSKVREQHHEEMALLLTHLAPLQSSATETPDAPKVPMTLEEAMLMPAVGREQIIAKRNYIAELQKERTARKVSESSASETSDDLTDEEMERVRHRVG